MQTVINADLRRFLLQLFVFPVLQQFGLFFKERLETIGLTSAQITTIINLNPCITSCAGEQNIAKTAIIILTVRMR